MAAYQTVQKKQLLAFLQAHCEEPFSVDALAQAMQNEIPQAEMPGKSTLYRLVQALVAEGRIKRVVQGNSRHFLYQFVNCADCCAHLHLRCTVCGCLLHLPTAQSNSLAQQLLQNYHFALDAGNTVLLGKCEKCRKAN